MMEFLRQLWKDISADPSFVRAIVAMTLIVIPIFIRRYNDLSTFMYILVVWSRIVCVMFLISYISLIYIGSLEMGMAGFLILGLSYWTCIYVRSRKHWTFQIFKEKKGLKEKIFILVYVSGFSYWIWTIVQGICRYLQNPVVIGS